MDGDRQILKHFSEYHHYLSASPSVPKIRFLFAYNIESNLVIYDPGVRYNGAFTYKIITIRNDRIS